MSNTFMEKGGTMAWEYLEGSAVHDAQADLARRMVGKRATDPEDEALLLSALGLD